MFFIIFLGIEGQVPNKIKNASKCFDVLKLE